MTISSEIDERALREIYLPPFEAAVNDVHVWAVMAAYNKLDSTYASEHPRLLTSILKREWGFDGVVMSDWFATHSTAEAVNAGLDLEMPGPTRHRDERLVQAVHSGEVSAESVRESARRVLRLIARVGAFDDPSTVEEQAIDRPEHRALIRRAGAEGIVLLKNEGVLPLEKTNLNTIAVIGPNARTAQIMGGGSAQLNAHYRISPAEGIAGHVGPAVGVKYAIGCTNNRLLPVLRGTFNVEYFNTPDLSGPVVFREERVDGESMWFNEVAQAWIGRRSRRGCPAATRPRQVAKSVWPDECRPESLVPEWEALGGQLGRWDTPGTPTSAQEVRRRFGRNSIRGLHRRDDQWPTCDRKLTDRGRHVARPRP